MNKEHQRFPTYLALLHIAIRISLANRAPITDCDEVFNYFEPLHFMNFGYGMQTWEYAPTYALRTYAYLLPMSIISRTYEIILRSCPGSVLNLLSTALIGIRSEPFNIHKPLQFHLLRATLAFFTSMTELRLIQSLPDDLSIPTWFILLTSTGMFHTAPAYLPSATVMVCFMNSIVEQMRGKMDRAIIWGLVSVLVTGWPFCGVLFIPLGFQAVYNAFTGTSAKDDESRQKHSEEKTSERGYSIASVITLLLRVVGYSILIQFIVGVVDYVYYGKVISPTWNIFVYNTGWGGDGINRDELYGVEDVSYYIKNLILNWNGVAVMGVLALPFLLLRLLIFTLGGRKLSGSTKQVAHTHAGMAVILLPAYLWMGIVFSRPHKEERFLFPIYPLLAIGTAIFLNESMEATGLHKISANYLRMNEAVIKMIMMSAVLMPCALISISRSMVLSDGYTAPLKIYTHLYNAMMEESRSIVSDHSGPRQLCVGGEWYRYPSSYHLPDDTRLAFLKSSFTGQLPQPFTEYGSKEESLVLQGRFNDLNEEEMDRYVDISTCSYAIELVRDDNGDDSELVQYMQNDQHEWEMITKFDFLDVEETSLLHRVLYLPIFRDAKYKKYSLFRKKNG